VRPKDGGYLDHVYCATDHNISLCGLDISDLSYADGDPDNFCVVCDDLEQAEVCAICGERDC
jgi:hypothetical protein